MSYRTADVEVRGGWLRVGIWESTDLTPEEPAARTVLAVHGVTSSHLAWALVGERLVAMSGTRLIAPDLPGRGRSNGLPGPWGLEQHAADLQAVIDVFGPVHVTAGHSIGDSWR